MIVHTNKLLLALALSLGLATLQLPAQADETADTEEAAEEEEIDMSQPAPLPKAPRMGPKGLRFGMSPAQVIKVYNRAIRRDFVPRFKAAHPGIEWQRVEYALDQAQQTFRRSLVEFDDKPNSMNHSNLSQEFTNNNKEAVMSIQRKGRQRHLFFIREQLWKVVDIHELHEKSRFGDNFIRAAQSVEKKLKTRGRPLAAGTENGPRFNEIDWADGKTHLRLADWGKRLAIFYVDKTTEANIDKLRIHKSSSEYAIDPEVKAVLRE